jgi:hypothetical protein
LAKFIRQNLQIMYKPTTQVNETNVYWDTTLGQLNALFVPDELQPAIPDRFHYITLRRYAQLEEKKKLGEEFIHLHEETRKFVDNIVGMLIMIEIC